MSDRRESLDGMAALVETVRTGSFSGAAKSFGMTPSGASKLIARLEQRLGIQLLKRTTRSMQLTEAGQLYYERACRVLHEIDSLERDLEDHRHHPKGRIALTAPTAFGGDLLMPVVIDFQRRYPEITVDLELTDRLVDVLAEEFDIAIRITDQPPKACIARKLAADVRILCASPDYLRDRQAPAHPDKLAEHQCITCSATHEPTRWHLRRELGGQVEPLTVSSNLSLNSTTAVHQAVLAGLGIGELPAYLVEQDLAAGRLVSLLAPYVPVWRNVYALYAASRLMPAKTRAFLNLLEANFPARGAVATHN